MRAHLICRVVCSLWLILFAVPASHARVVRVEIQSHGAVPAAPVGTAPVETAPAPAYEQWQGIVYGELDPADSHNAIIQDISLAPRNGRGQVEYAATFTLMAPVDRGSRSGYLVYEVVNRGASIVPKDFTSGDIFLSSGWQGDIPFGGKSIYGTPGETIRVPIAHQADGSTITGPLLLRFANMKPGLHTLPTRAATGYASSGPPPLPVDLDTRHARLTTHAYESVNGVVGGTQLIDPADWAWADCTQTPFPGKPDATHLCLRTEFNPALLYQLEFTGKDPLVLGIGLAAMRDVVSFFHHAQKDDAGNVNPVAGLVTHTVGVGASQSGNAIRTFLNLGFNQDEARRVVWEGVMPQIAARQTPLNLRFAIPGGASSLYEPGSDGTVWWATYTDTARHLPASGLLRRCSLSHTCPKVIEVLGASEFWSLRATPDFTGTDGKHDIPLPLNVRRYYIAGTQHGGGTGGFNWQPPPPRASAPGVQNPIATQGCVMPLNPNPEIEIDRALLVALKRWVLGTEPPPSAYPRLADGTLSVAQSKALKLPSIPGLPAPDGVANPLLVYDFGADFQAADLSGFITHNPPAVLGVIPAMAAVVNVDGNEIAGVKSVLLQAPLGTYTGWNVTESGFNKGQYCSLNGGYVPFAATRAARLAVNDPRLSLAERYGNRRGYLCAVQHAANGSRQPAACSCRTDAVTAGSAGSARALTCQQITGAAAARAYRRSNFVTQVNS